MECNAVKVDPAGKQLWSKTFDRGQDEVFFDGIATDDNGVVLLENSGKREQFFMGHSVIWLSEYDADGNKKVETHFTGRYGSITKDESETILVLYNRSRNGSQNVRLNSFTQNLEASKDFVVVQIKFGLEKFKIVSESRGGYIISVVINGRPFLFHI